MGENVLPHFNGMAAKEIFALIAVFGQEKIISSQIWHGLIADGFDVDGKIAQDGFQAKATAGKATIIGEQTNLGTMAEGAEVART